MKDFKFSGKFPIINNRTKRTLFALAVTLVFGFIYFYVTLPALNFQSREFYIFVLLLCLVFCAVTLVASGGKLVSEPREYLSFIKQQCKIPAAIALLLVAVFLVGSLLSVVIFRARAYRDLLTVEDGNFAEDVAEISYDQIPMLDKESASQLGNRKLGELADMVSQFEVADAYTQINYNGRPVRVTYLNYADFFKWVFNRSEGIPAYMFIDMTTQEVEVVRLTEGNIKYSPSEYFGRNLMRYIRFKYPTYMFSTPTFEIDEDGTPYWICPKVVKRIGLFGGTDVNGAVLVNAITGECSYYAADEVPSWCDRVYMAELIIEQYDYHGLYVNGFLNSIFGQKGVTVTTDGYNYIALNDDVFMYTGITSITGDQSNIGFILSNQRTKETRYYAGAGATEYSAMDSAEGVVQHLNYRATFPLLLNIDGQPTYFMALKDNAQLVKMYAMVNEQQYQIVATGSTVAACEQAYVGLMAQNGLSQGGETGSSSLEEIAGVIEDIRVAVIDGNSRYYFKLIGKAPYYSVSAAVSEQAVILSVGDRVKLSVASGSTGDIIETLAVTLA